MGRITVDLDERSIARLRQLAEHERRDLRQQAAWMILDGLREGQPEGETPERRRERQDVAR
jgi:hypothetical protein